MPTDDHAALAAFIKFSRRNHGTTFVLTPALSRDLANFVLAINTACDNRRISRYPLELIIQVFIAKHFE